MNLNIRVYVRVDINVDGLMVELMDEWTDERMENRTPILCHAKSRRNKKRSQLLFTGKPYMKF